MSHLCCHVNVISDMERLQLEIHISCYSSEVESSHSGLDSNRLRRTEIRIDEVAFAIHTQASTAALFPRR